MSVILSMTGYARHQCTHELGTLSFELRSVNHRYHELYCRLPELMSPFEPIVRRRLKEVVSRGKIELRVNFVPAPSAKRGPQLNRELLEGYRRAYAELAEELELRATPEMQDFWRLPELVSTEPQAAELSEEEERELSDFFLAGFEAVIARYQEARAAEGAVLAADIMSSLTSLRALHRVLTEKAPEMVGHFATRLSTRLEELLASERPEYYPEERVATEIALMADKLAIDEELVRLGAHFEAMAERLAAGSPVGKQLDFLVQEMNREINTTASKSNLLDITQICLEMKNLVEKIREQLQNIE